MRQITVDFTSQTYPLFAGYVGEHNATEITAIKPADLEGVTYSLAFMTNGEVIHSEFFGADEEIKVTLWQQLTQDNTLYVQLEAYDENGDYLGKSGMVKLVLSNSVHGMDMIADADNPDVYSEIAQNSAFREVLEDNADTLDKLTTSVDGKLLFDGKEIEGSSGNVSDELVEQIETNTENRHWHDNKQVLDVLTQEVLEAFDDMLSKAHTHNNRDVLNKFGESEEGLTYDEKPVGTSSGGIAQIELFNDDGNVFVFAEDGNSFTSGINQYVSKMLYIHFDEPVEFLGIGTRIAKIEIKETENSEYVSLASKCVDTGFPLIPLTQEVTSSDYGDVIFTGYGMFGLSQWWQDLMDLIIDWYSIRITYYTN